MWVWARDRKMWLLSREQMSLFFWLCKGGHVSAGGGQCPTTTPPPTCAHFPLALDVLVNL